ncbi:unnamed protein product [Rotaria sp. Silwood1]|nr:unnamed protein product [Rotaria sp. Silwood1]CAF3578683.1 unnamed protein product [Rotaria sp. Silwood1]CAF3656238.1 unnamed protein product [Rotaria sp. Silwood1]CAF3670757.1 unnamed protein product [Rotaria sp. Silwood1]CAF4668699.1 unnamed protein product [Rotaria sp. Silwood1]
MGCCYNTSNIVTISNTNPAVTAITEYEFIEKVISTIPLSQRDLIRRIPSHYFLTAYAFYKNAQNLLKHERFEEAELACNNAVDMLLQYLHPTHYIFQKILEIYTDSCLRREHFAKALCSTFTCILIHSEISSVDQASLSTRENFRIIEYYFRMGAIYKNMNDMKNALKYMLQARQMISSWPQVEEIINFTRIIDDNIRDVREPKLTIQPVHPRPDESDIDFSRRFTLEMAQFNAQRGTLQFDVSEFTRLPLKSTEYLITPAILKKVYKCLYNELSKNGLMARVARLAIESQLIAAQIKNSIPELKQNSLLTPMLIEAALTIVIDRQDEYCQKLKRELRFEIFYTDFSNFHQNGVRVFIIRYVKSGDD